MKTRLLCGMAFVAVLLAAMPVVYASAATNQVAREGGRVFRGNGGETLPPFRVSSPSTLFWANNGGIFQIFPSGGQLHGSVNSQGSKGWTYLPRGSYTLQVNAIGSWSLNVATGVVRPSRISSGFIGYSGNGGMELPPFVVPRSEQLYWQAHAGIFQIFSDGLSGANINSQASKGSTYVSAGAEQLQINTTGPWRIAWKP